MSLHGPTQTEKYRASLHDHSYLLEEDWATIGRHFLIVIFIAVTTWALCSLLRLGVEKGTEYLFEPFMHGHATTSALPEITLLGSLMLGGLIRGILISLPSWRDSDGDGAGASIRYFLQTYKNSSSIDGATKTRYKKPTFLRAFKRMTMTILTVGTGCSGGIEGPVIPMGECIGSGWSKLFKLQNADSLRAFQMAGISAAVATLLNAPFTAALFAAEIVFTDRIIYHTLFYSLFASIIAYALNNHLLYFQPLFSIGSHSAVYSLREYVEVILVATFCSAPAGLGIGYLFRLIERPMSHIPIYFRAAVGALCAGGVALLLWGTLGIEPHHVLGIGEETLRALLNNTGDTMLTVWWMLLLLVLAKCITTGFTLIAGGSVGLLIPAMFMGGLSGAAVYHLITSLGIPVYSSNPDLFIVAGIASSLVAIIEVPLATITFVMEVFGSNFGPAAIVSCVICHKFAKRFKLYAKYKEEHKEEDKEEHKGS